MSEPTMTVRFVFTGSRDFGADPDGLIPGILGDMNLDGDQQKDWWATVEIMHGGAKGFDTLIHGALKEHGWEPQVWRPDYDAYKPSVAPLIRNEQMVDWALGADRAVVVGMIHADTPKRGGTRKTLMYAFDMGAEVHVYRFS